MIFRTRSNKGWAAVYVIVIVIIALIVFVVHDKKRKQELKSRDECRAHMEKIESLILDTIKSNQKKLLSFQKLPADRWMEMTREKHELPQCPAKGTYSLTEGWRLECSKHPELSKDVEYLKNEIKSKTVVISKKDIQTKDIKYLNKARNYISLKDFEKASQYILMAIKENDKESEYYYLAAQCFNILKQSSKAKEYIDRALSMKSEKKYSLLSSKIEDSLHFRSLLTPFSGFSIVYVAKTPDGFDNICSISLDGKNSSVITDKYSVDSLTVLNNSTKIAFSENDNIRVMNPDGSNEQIIHQNMKFPCYNLTFSADNKHVLFNSSRFEPAPAIFMKDIYNSININDCIKVIGAEYQPGKPIWVSNTDIVFLSGYDAMAEIKRFNVFDKDTRPETLTNNEFIEENIMFVPALNSISFSSRYFIVDDKGKDIPSAREIYLLDLKTKKRNNLTRSVFDEDASNWSFDGDMLVFTEMNKNYEKDIFVMNPNGRNKKRCTFFKADPAYKDFGSNIVFIPGSKDLILFSFGSLERKNLYIADIRSGKTFQLTESLTDDSMYHIIKK